MKNLNKGKKVLVVNLLLIAILFGLISLNKELIRPRLVNNPLANVLTGCFPNFIAAYLISFAFVNAILIRSPKFGRLFVFTSSLIVFIVLTIEELKPMWGASTQYDIFDILASGISSLLVILTYELIIIMRRNKTKVLWFE